MTFRDELTRSFLVDLFVPKTKLRERERVNKPVPKAERAVLLDSSDFSRLTLTVLFNTSI